MTDMKRYAFFVEGLTERLFLIKLLIEIFGEKRISFEVKKISGGSKSTISIITIFAQSSINGGYYILIYDCGGDSNIRSYIEDQRTGLINAGYIKIYGIRDVFPTFRRTEIATLIKGLYFRLPQNGIPIKFILSIMEIEAWFLAEENHFQIIDPNLTLESIQNNHSFDPSNFNTELFDEPAEKLRTIYQTVGKSYKKSQSYIERTINALDCANIYINVCTRVNSLGELITEINSFFN